MSIYTPPIAPVQLAERFLTDLIAEEKAFDIAQARLSALTDDGVILLGALPDVYGLLDEVDVPAGVSALLLHTTGWAAPLAPNGESEGLPSEHPQRRRVALIAVISDRGAGSALAFNDDPEHLVTDEGSATGALAEALADAWSRAC